MMVMVNMPLTNKTHKDKGITPKSIDYTKRVVRWETIHLCKARIGSFVFSWKKNKIL